jgi:hypothetical protein
MTGRQIHGICITPWHTHFPQLCDIWFSMAMELTFLIHFIVSSSQQTTFEQIDIHISSILERERKAGH